MGGDLDGMTGNRGRWTSGAKAVVWLPGVTVGYRGFLFGYRRVIADRRRRVKREDESKSNGAEMVKISGEILPRNFGGLICLDLP
jgi:hypothetical protein